jgi:hypothetical protein
MDEESWGDYLSLVFPVLSGVDPSERAVGSIFSLRPDLFNYHAFGLAHVATPEAWPSTWSGLSSRANLILNLPAVGDRPTLVLGAMADQDIFIPTQTPGSRPQAPPTSRLEFIEGADHFMRAGGSRMNLGDARPRLMNLVTGRSPKRKRAEPFRARALISRRGQTTS